MAPPRKPPANNRARVATGRRVAELRTKHALSQGELGDAVGVRTGTIWRIEKGLRGASEELLGKIAAALGTTEPFLRYGASRVAEPKVGYAAVPGSLKEFLATPEGATATPEDVADMMDHGERFTFEPTAVTWRLLLAALRSGERRPAPTPNKVRYKHP